ncbi:MAG: biotin/lipoyl-containing protein [Erysipelotrichaceae bacterium]|nr:biotin/lipoyl-containing protein [Erysipelotrichaceae bacterium]
MKIENIEQIIKLFERSTVSKMEIESGDLKIKLEKDSGETGNYVRIPNVSSPTLVVEPDSDTLVKAPLVGTFYGAVNPQSAPFVQIGEFVSAGTVLCLIEAMKVMNEIKAPVEGVVLEILGRNGEMVAYDQPLIRLGEST